MVKQTNRNTFANKKTLPKRNGIATTRNAGRIIKKTIGKPKITDARQKIIQKKRTHVVDARDVLANMAKTQDARTKLQKLRGVVPTTRTPKTTTNIKQIGKNIVQKTDKNGKICLMTNKNRPVNNITNKIRQQLGIGGVTGAVPKIKKAPPKRKDTGQLSLRRTIANDYQLPQAFYPDVYQHPGFSGASPMLAPSMRRPMMNMDQLPMFRSMGLHMVNDATSGNWKTYPTAPARANSNGFMEVESDDEIMQVPSRPGMTRMASNVHSRLDTAPPATKTKVVVPAGHRIVVSNLQSTVTQDDIRELFEDIGQLLVARLVRPGTAEVIYKQLKDAQKAVDTYHNRQLDGQPMKCLLVNKRPGNNPTAPPMKSEGMRSAMANTSKAEKLIPDLSTIHKVLFQRH